MRIRGKRQGIPVRCLAAYNGIRSTVPEGSVIYSETISIQGNSDLLLALVANNPRKDITHWVAKIFDYKTQVHDGRRYIIVNTAGFDAYYLVDRLSCMVYNDPTALQYEIGADNDIAS